MQTKHLIWLNTVGSVAWERNPLRLACLESWDRLIAISQIPKNVRITKEEVARYQQQLRQVEQTLNNTAVHGRLTEQPGQQLNKVR